MPNIKKTAKNILYICKRWIAGKLYIISVWTKDKIAEIKSEGIKGIEEKLWMFQKKQIISVMVILIILTAGITTTVIHYQKYGADEQVSNTDFSKGKVKVLLKAELPSGEYIIKETNGGTKLYINGDAKKNVNYDKLPVMHFNMNESELSDDILKTADADHVVDVGGKVYRSKRIYAERFYSFLLSNGYVSKAYIITGSYLDAYFENDGQLLRFLYIKKTEDTGVLIFGECENKVPVSIKKIINGK